MKSERVLVAALLLPAVIAAGTPHDQIVEKAWDWSSALIALASKEDETPPETIDGP